MACFECGEKLYQCENCRHFYKNTISSWEGNESIYDWCAKFDSSTYKIRKALGQIRCPVWELPKNVNFCKTCGRPLRENK